MSFLFNEIPQGHKELFQYGAALTVLPMSALFFMKSAQYVALFTMFSAVFLDNLTLDAIIVDPVMAFYEDVTQTIAILGDKLDYIEEYF